MTEKLEQCTAWTKARGGTPARRCRATAPAYTGGLCLVHWHLARKAEREARERSRP